MQRDPVGTQLASVELELEAAEVGVGPFPATGMTAFRKF